MSWFALHDETGAAVGRVFAQTPDDLAANTLPGWTAVPDPPRLETIDLEGSAA